MRLLLLLLFLHSSVDSSSSDGEEAGSSDESSSEDSETVEQTRPADVAAQQPPRDNVAPTHSNSSDARLDRGVHKRSTDKKSRSARRPAHGGPTPRDDGGDDDGRLDLVSMVRQLAGSRTAQNVAVAIGALVLLPLAFHLLQFVVLAANATFQAYWSLFYVQHNGAITVWRAGNSDMSIVYAAIAFRA